MIDEDAFLQTILNSPNDPLPMLVFADWLEERGDARFELLRLLHVLTHSIEVPGRDRLEDRLRGLLESGVKPVGPFITNALGMEFALISPGTFLMGSPKNEEGRSDDETQHKVTLTKGFLLGIHPVTQAFWQTIMGGNPSRNKGDDLPVESVSWEDCQEFLAKLSEKDGQSYRLPTEAEWEYACRAGTKTPFSFGMTITAKQANFAGGPGKTTAPGSYEPNAWGLYDMHGNVWEWCADWYAAYAEGDVVDPAGPESGSRRVLRGGSFFNLSSSVRSASRNGGAPTNRVNLNGFRLARTLTP